MDRIAIIGGAELNGTIPISGAKNSALKLMAASLLTDQPVRLTNMPRLADTKFLGRLLQRLGAGQPLHGLPLLLDALVARLAGAAFVADGRWPEVLGRFAVDALHLKADVLTSLGVAVGLLGIWIADGLGYNLYLLDPIVAICVAIFILREAITMLNQAFQPLLDHSMNEEELAITTQVIEQCCPEHGGFHALRSRQAGRRRHIDFHLTLPKEMSIEHSHAICDRIEQGIMRHLPHAIVLIHVEPSGHG